MQSIVIIQSFPNNSSAVEYGSQIIQDTKMKKT